MHIWVDSDACPKPIREILFRVAGRLSLHVTFVANQPIACPPSRFLHALQVPKGFDVADNEITKRMTAGDVVITQDIPLAATVLGNGGHCLNPHGEMFTRENMAERLALRNLTDTLRNAGMVDGGGRDSFSTADRAAFANALDRLLTRLLSQA